MYSIVFLPSSLYRPAFYQSSNHLPPLSNNVEKGQRITFFRSIKVVSFLYQKKKILNQKKGSAGPWQGSGRVLNTLRPNLVWAEPTWVEKGQSCLLQVLPIVEILLCGEIFFFLNSGNLKVDQSFWTVHNMQPYCSLSKTVCSVPVLWAILLFKKISGINHKFWRFTF